MKTRFSPQRQTVLGERPIERRLIASGYQTTCRFAAFLKLPCLMFDGLF